MITSLVRGRAVGAPPVMRATRRHSGVCEHSDACAADAQTDERPATAGRATARGSTDSGHEKVDAGARINVIFTVVTSISTVEAD